MDRTDLLIVLFIIASAVLCMGALAGLLKVALWLLGRAERHRQQEVAEFNSERGIW